MGVMRELMLQDAWDALGGAPGATAALEVRSAGPVLAGPLHVEELLVAAAGCALLAAAELVEVRSGRRPEVAIDTDRLAVAAGSERWVLRDGKTVGAAFDPLSAFMPAADGWVRLHGNYAWHRDALRRALGDGIPEAVRRLPALEVERSVVAAGGCAAAVRSASPLPAQPLVRWSAGPAAETPPAAVPRIVDFTRVIAGPVGTRMLAALGCEVIRIDDPRRPELPVLEIDGMLGKRRLALDLREAAARAEVERLLAGADAAVLGHRPGALDAFGLHPDALAERHPQLVVVTLSAWGETGPWATRRGFDSLVQAATGIAEAVRPATPQDAPGALPVQALDHGTGYLIAAAVLRALAVRAREGRSPRARLALAATADALLQQGRREPPEDRDVDPEPHLVTLGRVRVARPPGILDGTGLRWPRTPVD
jgi:hypothetical protein